MQLPIKLQKDVTLYTYHSLILPIIESNEKLTAWKYNHFINIYMRQIDNGLYWDYTDFCMKYYEPLFVKTQIHYEFIDLTKDIIDIVKRAIDKNYYVHLWVDNFHLPTLTAYHKYHYVHPILIYGYCGNIFNTIFFDTLKGVFTSEILFDNVRKAFYDGLEFKGRGASNLTNGSIELLKLKEFLQDYHFKLDNFMKEFYDLIHSKGDINSLFYEFNFEPDPYIYEFGLNVYDKIIHAFIQANTNELIDYRAIHMLKEHSHLIYERIKYVIETYGIFENSLDLLSDYKQICNEWSALAGRYKKQSLIESEFKSFNSPPSKSDFKQYFASKLEKLKDAEYNTLIKIYDMFDRLLLKSDISKFKPEISKTAIIEINKEQACVKLNWDQFVYVDKIRMPKGQLAKIAFSDSGYLDVNPEMTDIDFKTKKINAIEFQTDNLLMDFATKSYFPPIEIYESSLCKDKPIIVSSNSKGLYNYCCPEYIYNSNNDQFWSSDDFKGKGEYILIDLCETVTFNNLVVQQFRFLPRVLGYKLETSFDGIFWSEVFKSNIKLGSLPKSDIFSDTSARYIKLIFTETLTDRFGFSCPNITKVEIYKR